MFSSRTRFLQEHQLHWISSLLPFWQHYVQIHGQLQPTPFSRLYEASEGDNENKSSKGRATASQAKKESDGRTPSLLRLRLCCVSFISYACIDRLLEN
jgi:hypothetical protein